MRVRLFVAGIAVIGVGVAACYQLGERGGLALESLLNALVPTLIAPWFAPLFSAVLLAVGATILLVYLGLYIAPTILVAATATRRLAHSKTVDSDALGRQLSKSPDLKHAWQGFEQTFKPTNRELGGFSSTKPARLFFNGRAIRAASVGHQIFPTLSGVFVGVGLLLTFVGLLAALNAAAGSVASADVKKAQEGLQALLHAATFKFWTSIAGLFISIVLGIFFRLFQSTFDHRVEILANAIQRKVPVESSDHVAQDAIDLQRQQLDQLRKFNTEIAFTIGKTVSTAMEQGIRSSLSATFEPIVKRLEAISQQINANSEKSLTGLTEQVKTSISDAANPHLENLEKALTRFTEVVSKHDGSAEQTKTLLANQTDLIEKTESAAKAFQKIGEDIQRIAGPLTQTVGQLTTASTQLETSTASAANVFARAQAELQRIHGALSELTEKMGAVYQKHEDRFSGLDKSLEQAITKFGEHVNAITSNLSQYVKEIDAGTKGALQSLGAAVEQISEAAEDIADSVSKLSDTSRHMSITSTAVE